MKFFISIFLFVITSCSDKITITGIVVDRLSNVPLDSVSITDLGEVRLKGYDWVSTYTLPNGSFMLLYSSREIKKKSKVPFIFQKRGYGSVVEFYPKEQLSDTIYLQKLQ